MSTVSTKLTDADEHGTRSNRTGVEEDPENKLWDAMDLGGHGLKSMGATLFRHYPHLRKIYFNHNRLTTLQPHISLMRYLTILDLSFNQLSELPPEIGMLTNLKKLLLFDNRLEDLPYEIGYLYQLEMLGLEGNPMRRAPDYMERLVEQGTQELVRYLREEAPRKLFVSVVWVIRDLPRLQHHLRQTHAPGINSCPTTKPRRKTDSQLSVGTLYAIVLPPKLPTDTPLPQPFHGRAGNTLSLTS